jgi:hypothetical protein
MTTLEHDFCPATWFVPVGANGWCRANPAATGCACARSVARMTTPSLSSPNSSCNRSSTCHLPWPDPSMPGNHAAALLLRDALRLKLRAGGGPFRSFGNIAVEPRGYQLVPLLMALRLTTVRLLIADDVGIGKTIEAGLIARELMDRGEIARLAVLCPPHLVEQWQSELETRFNLQAVALTSSSAARIERDIPAWRQPVRPLSRGGGESGLHQERAPSRALPGDCSGVRDR